MSWENPEEATSFKSHKSSNCFKYVVQINSIVNTSEMEEDQCLEVENSEIKCIVQSRSHMRL